MPTGKHKHIKAYDLEQLKKDILNNKLFGFVQADIETPEDLKDRLAGTGDVYCNVGGVGSGRGSSAPTSGGLLGLGFIGSGQACAPARHASWQESAPGVEPAGPRGNHGLGGGCPQG
jgi:hypothetical protein